MKNKHQILIVLFILSILSSCTSYKYYHSDASIPRYTNNCKTTINDVDPKFGRTKPYFFRYIRTSTATDYCNGKITNYLILYNIYYIDDYNKVILNKKQVEELISVIDESISILEKDEIEDNQVHIEYAVTPDYSSNQSNSNAFIYNLYRENNHRGATISFLIPVSDPSQRTDKIRYFFNYTFDKNNFPFLKAGTDDIKAFRQLMKVSLDNLIILENSKR